MSHPDTIAIYCCGPTTQGRGEDRLTWTDTERAQVSHGLSPALAHFLHVDGTTGQLGHNLYRVSVATVVIVDARERRDLGIGIEIAAAASLGIPIVVVAPPDTYYHGTSVDDYLADLANVVVADFEDAGLHALEFAMHPPERNKWLLEAISEYRRASLLGDHPMQHVLALLDQNERRMLHALVAQCQSDRYAHLDPVPPQRQLVHDLVTSVEPNDPYEAVDVDLIAQWIECGSPLYRTDDPATRDQHLCVYFVPFDDVRRRILLIDHIKARRWLPPGGHIEVDEDPRDAVRREADEELKLKAEFHPMFGDKPFFVTITKTRAPSNCTDVTLWFVIKADEHTALQPDPWEMNDARWFDLADHGEWETQGDRNLPRFLDKLETYLPPPS
jgi:8-oxo-dGTP diphosphatase